MPESFTVPLQKVRPSQYYLNADTVTVASEWFDFDDPNYDALPVRRFGGEDAGRWTLTDGHTRAFLAALAGEMELRIYEDPDDLPDELYRECIEWCQDADVTRIQDLVGRVVSAETFQTRWIDRCQQAGKQLENEA